VSRHEVNPLSPAAEEIPGLRRALALLREEARSFPGAEGTSALFAVQRAFEREIGRLERSGGAR
jgi:hypothetical protein